MRLALISNWQAREGCGVANFGRDWKAALERAGHTVEALHWVDPPVNVDLVLYNWHPFTAPTVVPWHQIPCAVYLHDIPPHSLVPSTLLNAVAYYSSEPSPGCVEIPYPIYDAPLDPVPLPMNFTVGWSGIRGDGRDQLEALCARWVWAAFNPSVGWLDTPQEIQRLKASSVIVLWYHASDRGQSLALSTALATGRPILINKSKMFRLADRSRGEVYRAGQDTPAPLLEPSLEFMVSEQLHKRLRVPSEAFRRQFGWAEAIRTMEATWPRI